MKNCYQDLSKIRQAYLIAGGSFNSAAPFKRGFKCRQTFRCKRVQCEVCFYYRRSHFISSALKFFADKGTLNEVVVKFPMRKYEQEEISQWLAIYENMPKLSKGLSKKIKAYVRTLGVGRVNGNPHVHFIIKAEDYDYFVSVVRRTCAKGTSVYAVRDEVYDLKDLLGYFYDQNFYMAFIHPYRPKGIRILSGSRPIACGFPKKKKASV